MSSPILLDASALLAWLLGDDPTLAERVEAVIREEGKGAGEADGEEGTELIALVLMRAEVANGLMMAQRRQRITAAQATQAAALADSVPIRDEPATQGIGELLQVSRAQKLTAYDAQYLELAMRRGAAILSADQALLAAAKAAGLPS